MQALIIQVKPKLSCVFIVTIFSSAKKPSNFKCFGAESGVVYLDIRVIKRRYRY